MGSLKDKALQKDGIKSFNLTEQELNFVKLMNAALQFNTYGTKIMSGFLYYVATTRLGYKMNDNLIFELDLDKGDGVLNVKLVPEMPQPPEQPVDKPA